MKIQTALIVLILAVLLSACNNPIVIPANVAVTLPANQDFIVSATAPVTPGSASVPVEPSATATATATITPSPTATPTETPTLTPVPTHKSPFPAAQGTPLIDSGFQTISVDNLQLFTLVFSALESSLRHHAISADGQKLFLSSSNGTFLFNRAGEMLAHWRNIFTADFPCENCISVNSDGSRFAVITRNSGAWEAQVYDVQTDQATLALALPVEGDFNGLRNDASIAISPDNNFLAFRAGTAPLRVIDLKSGLQVLGYDRTVDGIRFTPDGLKFIIHSGQELLFYDTSTWKLPGNLLLPRADTPFSISPNGQLLAIAMPTKIRAYSLENLQIKREINVPPGNANTRQWEIAFADDKTLNGYGLRWDTLHTSATVDNGQWDLDTGNVIRFDTTTEPSPDALAALWGAALPLPAAKGDLEAGKTAYQAFRFISDGFLLVNSPHSACWMKLFTAETTCFKDPDHILFASDGNTLKEVLDISSTSLVDRSEALVIQVGAYRIAAINRSGEWALIDTGSSTDLYTKGKKLPQESVKGLLQGFAENQQLIVFSAREKENTFTITVVEKATGNGIYQKKDNFLYKPLLMTADGTIYYLQNELDRNQTVLNVIEPVNHQISEVTRLALPAEPVSMTLSSTGLFAIGQKDGSVLVMNRDGGQSASFQAATSAIDRLAFSPDGRFLAVASAEGVRVFAVLP